MQNMNMIIFNDYQKMITNAIKFGIGCLLPS